MEKQFQVFFDKLKIEMQNQTNELTYSISYTNMILNRIDEKLKDIVEGIKQSKAENASVANNGPVDSFQEPVSQQGHQSPAPVAEVSEGTAAKKTTSKRTPIKRKAPASLAKKKVPAGKTARRPPKKCKKTSLDEDSDEETANESDSTPEPDSGEDQPQIDVDDQIRECMRTFMETLNLKQATPKMGRAQHHGDEEDDVEQQRDDDDAAEEAKKQTKEKVQQNNTTTRSADENGGNVFEKGEEREMASKPRPQKLPTESHIRVPAGTGFALERFYNIRMAIRRRRVQQLRTLHQYLFGQIRLDRHAKLRISKFKGYEWAIGSSEYKAKLEKTSKMKLSQLRSLCSILNLNNTGSTKEMSVRLVDFVQRPGYIPSGSQGKVTFDPQTGESAALDPQAGESAACDPQASESAALDPQAGESAVFDSQVGETAACDPQASESAALDPQAGESAVFDPQAGETAACDPQARESAAGPGGQANNRQPTELPFRVPAGTGEPLGDFFHIDYILLRISGRQLQPLHQYLYGQLCLDRNVKRNIRKFKGYEWAIGSSEYKAKLEETARMEPKLLRSLLFILDLNIEGSVEKKAKQLVDFVQRPIRNQQRENVRISFKYF